MDPRVPEKEELDRLATIWFDGWQDAHAAILPDALRRARTWQSFRDRLAAALSDVRAAGPVGAPVGFCITKGAELYQLFVSAEARGTGVAAALVADAEARIAADGFDTAWLDCAIGNDRAARFYEKRGWRRAGTVASVLALPEGEIALEVWRYERSLDPDAGNRWGVGSRE